MADYKSDFLKFLRGDEDYVGGMGRYGKDISLFYQKFFMDNSYVIPDGLKEHYKVYLRLPLAQKQLMPRSYTTSYFTPPYLVDSIVNSIRPFLDDFKKPLRVLEPACGVGAFVKPLSTTDSSFTMVEQDKHTFERLKKQFSDAFLEKNEVLNIDFEKFDIEKNKGSYDLVLGNFPFEKLLSKKMTRLNIGTNIQNMFIDRSLYLLREGGLACFLVSRSFADNGKKFRERVFEKSNLLGAVRLDNETFKSEDTRVVADIILLQKTQEKKEFTEIEKQFLKTSELQVGLEGQMDNISAYFKENETAVLGELAGGFMFNKPTLTVSKKQDNSELLYLIAKQIEINLKQNFSKELFENNFAKKTVSLEDDDPNQLRMVLPENIVKRFPHLRKDNLFVYNNILGSIEKEGEDLVLVYDLVEELSKNKQPSLFEQDKKMVAPILSKKDLAFYENYIEVRESYKAFQKTKERQPLHVFQKYYGSFSDRFGSITQNKERFIIKQDDEEDKLDVDFEAVTSTEVKLGNGKYVIANFLQDNALVEKTIGIAPEKLSLKELLERSYNDYNGIHIDYITNHFGSDSWIKEGLENKLIFINPCFDRVGNFKKLELSSKEDFLSGLIFKKVNHFFTTFKERYHRKEGEKHILHNLDFAKGSELVFENLDFLNQSVLDLKAIRPPVLSVTELDFNFGEPFVPVNIYRDFIRGLVGSDAVDVQYFSHLGAYKIVGGYYDSAPRAHYYDIEGVHTNGMGWKKFFETALSGNYKQYKYSRIENGDKVWRVDQEFTLNVHKKIDEINQKFKDFLIKHENHKLIKEVVQRYYLLNNAFVEKKHRANFVTFPFLKDHITPHLHQKEAMMKIVFNGGGIIDHKVGFGKTLSMGLINQRMKAVGMPNKTLLLAMKANYKDIYRELSVCFPKARILFVDAEKMTKNKFLYDIANSHWDFVVMSHSSITKLPKDPEVQNQILQEKITELNEVVYYYHKIERKQDFLSKRALNNLVEKKENLVEEYKYNVELQKSKEAESFLTFKDLGFDYIMVDESHQFKNLGLMTRLEVTGLGDTKGSQKCDHLLSLVRSVQSQYPYGDKGVVFLSGTTISNSLVELYNLFRYVRPQKMKELSINSFDQWARSYTKISREFETKLSGDVKLVSRCRYFEKVPELQKLYRDITHYADEKNFDIESPQAFCNEPVVLEPYPEQKKYLDNIRKFLKTNDLSLLYNKTADDYDSEKLVMAKGLIAMSEGRKATLDMRAIDNTISPDINSKVQQCALMIKKQYDLYQEHRGVQIVFSDLLTPNKDPNTFSIYTELKLLLTSAGIPEHEVAFIHDWDSNSKKKEAFFDRVNKGEVRVVMGSTQKLGTGVNIQKRVVHIYHLDVPYRPSDFEQRLGRGARQGNELAKKHLNNRVPSTIFAVKNSTDGYMINLLMIKNNFIKQFKQVNQIQERTFDTGDLREDGSMDYRKYLEVTQPDSKLPKMLKLEAEVKQLEMLRMAEMKEYTKKKYAIENAKSNLENVENNLQKYEGMQGAFDDQSITVQLSGKDYTLSKDQKEIGEHIQKFHKEKVASLTPLLRKDPNYKRDAFFIGKTSNNFVLVLKPIFTRNNVVDGGLYKTDVSLDFQLILKDAYDNDYTYKSSKVVKDTKDVGNYIVNAYNDTVANKIKAFSSNITTYKDFLKNSGHLENFSFKEQSILDNKKEALKDIKAELKGEEESSEKEKGLKKAM